MQEVVLFLDERADVAVDRAAAFIRGRGLTITHRSPYSVSFAGDGPTVAAPTESAAARGAGVLGKGTPGEGALPPGAGQCAAVPMQVRPEWCRLWVTVNGIGPAAEVAAALVDQERDRSRRIEAVVRALEADVYAESGWPQVEATLRASLQNTPGGEPALEAKIATFKQRWLALGRKAAKAPPEEHLSA